MTGEIATECISPITWGTLCETGSFPRVIDALPPTLRMSIKAVEFVTVITVTFHAKVV